MTARPRAPATERPEFTWDTTRLRLTWANPTGIRFWGEDSLLDLTERVFAPGDETVRALAVREAEMVSGASVARVTLYPQGDPIWALAECHAQRRTDGRTLMWIGLDDIEAVNDHALVRKRAGYDAAPRPMVIFDQLGTALVRNEADRRSYPEAGDTIDARYAEPGEGQRALVRALAEGAFSHTAMIQSAPIALRHRISLRRMRDPATARMCVIADFTDLSDRPASVLETGRRSKPAAGGVSTEALARIAHDIRAPLSAISGLAEMLHVMRDSLPQERHASALRDITEACKRLTALTDRIVALGAHGDSLQLSMVDLTAVCAHAARLYAAEAAASGVTMTMHLPHGPMALADESAVMRILDNLIRNALSHGHREGGSVTLSAGGGQAGDAPWIEVADDGPGTAPEKTRAAIDAYRQAGGDDASKETTVVHGLGVANVMTLAKDMAATVAIKTAPGEGFSTRITFEGPRAE